MADSILGVNKDDIMKLTNKISNLLVKLEITKEKENISIVDCITIIGEIGKGISELNSLKTLIVNVDPSDKASMLLLITVAILNSDAVSEKLSPGVRKQIEEFANNGEALAAISDLVNWVSDEVLEEYDADDNGAVTVSEVQAGCVKCCKCCPKGGKFFGKLWGNLLVKVLCCGCSTGQIIYDKKKYENSSAVNSV